MKLSNYLDSKFVFFDLLGDSFDECLNNLILSISSEDRTFKSKSNKISEEIDKIVKLSPLIYGGSFVIPLVSDNYDDFLVSIGFLNKKYIDFQGEDINSIILVIVPRNRSKKTITIMTSLADILSKHSLVDINPLNFHSIYSFILSKESVVDEILRVSDFVQERKPLYKEEYVANVLSRFFESNVFSLPVVDEKGMFVGEVLEIDIIKKALPITSYSENIMFFRNIDFSDYLKKLGNLKVLDIMNTKTVTADIKASFTEIASLILSKQTNRVFVLDKGEYIGTVSTNDVVRQMLKF